MSNTVPIQHFVRCPKCLKILREPPDVSLYGCGGCGAILLAKSHSSNNGETLSLASAASSSKNVLNSGSFENGRTSFGKQALSSSDSSGGQDQVVMGGSPKVYGSSGERNMKFEFSGNEMKNHAESKFNLGSFKDVRKSQAGEQSETNSLEEDQLPNKPESSLNEKAQNSSNQDISKVGGSVSSSNKGEESSESHGHDTISEEDAEDGKMRKSSSHAYDGSVSSADKKTSRSHFQAIEQDFSLASKDFHSALDFTRSGNGAISKSRSKDTRQFVKSRHTEKTDQMKILRKVDELRNDLRVLFNRAAGGKRESRLNSSPHLPEVLLNQCQPLHTHKDGICCHNEHCKQYQHHGCCPLPEGSVSTRPLHIKHSPLRQRPQTQKSNYKGSTEVKRHCRPVSGGAPFVMCYRCFNLLQLPADFLVSTRRNHKLRCGSCSEVLWYCFRPRTRPAARTPAEVQLPPGEDDKKYNRVLDDEVRAPHVNHLREGGPVSYSEEYDPSSSKSNSYEAKPSAILVRNYGPIMEEEHGGNTSSGAKLHKLMGYSSARHLLFETLRPVDGYRTEQDR